MALDLQIRADPVIGELDIDACFYPRMEAAFDAMDFDLTGELANVVPSVGSSATIRDFVSPINLAFELAYARFDTDSYYSWVSVFLMPRLLLTRFQAPYEGRRLAVSILGVLMILEARNIHIQSRLILNNRLFRNDPPDTITCGLDEEAVST